jgi:hypothetical protein
MSSVVYVLVYFAGMLACLLRVFIYTSNMLLIIVFYKEIIQKMFHIFISNFRILN